MDLSTVFFIHFIGKSEKGFEGFGLEVSGFVREDV